jgi:hypothetical protein
MRGICPSHLTKWQKDFTDATYWPTTLAFRREVARICYQILKENGLDRWKKHHDCDNFALLYHWVAHGFYAKCLDEQIDNGLVQPGEPAQAPAIGQISYLVWNSKFERPGSGHRINFFVDENEPNRLQFAEPQALIRLAKDGEYVELHPNEKRTIWKVYA